MKLVAIAIMTLTITGCSEEAPSNAAVNKFVQLSIKEDNTTPTVDIKDFILITNDAAADTAEAKEIMRTKRKVPVAMQRKDSALFNEALAKTFTFRAEDEFYNREDYIKDRIAGRWNIDTVRYQNLVLQLFGNRAMLTYRNVLNGTDDDGKPDTEYYSWGEMFIKENGKWKVASLHQVDARIDYTGK